MSDYVMVINYLKKDELQYELKLRGVAISDEETVAELRSYLRPLLRFEKVDKTLHYPKYDFDPTEELKIIHTKLNEIEALINEFSGTKASAEFSRINTRLVHLLRRNDRIPTSSESSPEILRDRSQLMMQILNLMEALEIGTVSKDSDDVGALFTSMRVEDQSDGDLPVDESVASGGPMNYSAVANIPATSGQKTQPVSKWNLKFSGDARHLSVHNFLERVQELQFARGVSDQQLFESAIDLFDGKALLWYRSNRSRFRDWKGLSKLLVHHYQPPDYKPRLLQEIMSRVQDPSESIVDYLVCMNAMFGRYGVVPEDVRLGIISRNLSPFYTMQLPPVANMAQLEEECLKLEAKKHRADAYKPPSNQKRRDLVEPDFAYLGMASSSCHDSASSSAEVYEFRSQGSTKCWNCLETGHLMRDCKFPKKKRCYQCGKPSFTIRTCPTCSGNGRGEK